jgi:hypothetical protein
MEASSATHLLFAGIPPLTIFFHDFLPAMERDQRTAADLFTPVQHSPPDLQTLNATFLI